MVVFEPSRYKRWEEVYVSTDKGKREVHYFLKRRNGSGSDLVVVGKETTLRHFSYRYVIPNSASLSKLRSRREVVDWLDSLVNSGIKICKSVGPAQTPSEGNIVVEGSNVVKKLPTKLKWVGSPWTCRKRRTHYPSFCRNGVNISVHDFVFVLAEEGKQLIAHLDDMYEDSKGNKMVVVQWFHKIDEVGTDLPPHYYDREIYFSLCLQDLSIECIDGLATVLSPEHYEIYLNGPARLQIEPFVCHRLFDNDEVKSFDVTKVKGYWKQNLVKCFDSRKKHHPVENGHDVEKQFTDADENRPRKRLRKSGKALQSHDKKVDTGSSLQKCVGNLVGSKSKGQMELGGVLREIPSSLPNKSAVEQKNQHLRIGSKVEVLSEDSGIRGCWFRALIVKKYKDRVKVQYQDVMDAGDETKNLEEWVLALKIAASDGLGIRISGRTTIRPAPPKSPNVTFNVGTIVDVFRHDGWWEGIILEKEPKDCFRVYFPGEKQESVFSCAEIRFSQEWFENDWNLLKERPDLASEISGRESKPAAVNSVDTNPKTDTDKENKQPNEAPAIRDLSKDDVFLQLKWKSSGRRRRSRSPVNNKLRFLVQDSRRKRADDPNKQASYQRLFDIASKKGESENCKVIGDTGFSSSAVTNLNSLVMTR